MSMALLLKAWLVSMGHRSDLVPRPQFVDSLFKLLLLKTPSRNSVSNIITCLLRNIDSCLILYNFRIWEWGLGSARFLADMVLVPSEVRGSSVGITLSLIYQVISLIVNLESLSYLKLSVFSCVTFGNLSFAIILCIKLFIIQCIMDI